VRAAVASILLAAACAAPIPPAAAPVDAPVVRTWIEGTPARGAATLVVQVEAPAGADVVLPEPEVPNLTLTPIDAATTERLGAATVHTRRYRLSGPEGSYEIPALSAGGAPSAPLWVDLGRPPAALDGLVDIADPEPVWRVGPALVVGGVCVGLTALGALGAVGLVAWSRRRGRAVVVPPEPPDVLALRRWEAVRADPTLDDHAVAVAIATILRDYLEAVLAFPATAWTTREIVDHLAALPHLPEGNVGRAKRILGATDRIKYADARARDALFDELDDALRSLVASTRPRGLEAPR
jgi:hypothetical protein